MEHLSLTFPLNVYAHILFLETGSVEYLHYGIWDEQHLSVKQAQQRSTELILHHLPEPPCDILEIGIGTGTTFGLLAERGYAVTGLTPDRYQHVLALKRNNNAPGIILSSFEEYDPGGKQYDVVLLQESLQYLDPLQFFEKARAILSPGGRIIILDEFGMIRQDAEPEGLPFLRYVMAQAGRWGFREDKIMDLSSRALPTVDYLLHQIKKYRAQLAGDLGLEEAQLEKLVASLRRYSKKYRSGEYGYALVCLTKDDKPPRWRISPLQGDDVAAVRRLFVQVFGQEMSHALWQWKYGGGRGLAVVGRRDLELVSHYGGMIRDILFKGEPRQEVQIGDVMVAPGERGAFTRKGLFFLTAATFIERYIGFGAKFLVGFGFPNERVMRLAKLQGLYAEVDRVDEVRWPPASKLPCLLTRLHSVSLEAYDREAGKIDALWEQMAADLQDAIVGVRHAAFIKHRYLEHPEKEYEVILVKNRFTRSAKGLIVLRREENRCLLLDLSGPLSAIPLLIKHARRLTGLWGKEYLYTWITKSHAEKFVTQNAQINNLDIFIPMNRWTSTLRQDEVRGAWWLMPGDTDFL